MLGRWIHLQHYHHTHTHARTHICATVSAGYAEIGVCMLMKEKSVFLSPNTQRVRACDLNTRVFKVLPLIFSPYRSVLPTLENRQKTLNQADSTTYANLSCVNHRRVKNHF